MLLFVVVVVVVVVVTVGGVNSSVISHQQLSADARPQRHALAPGALAVPIPVPPGRPAGPRRYRGCAIRSSGCGSPTGTCPSAQVCLNAPGAHGPDRPSRRRSPDKSSGGPGRGSRRTASQGPCAAAGPASPQGPWLHCLGAAKAGARSLGLDPSPREDA